MLWGTSKVAFFGELPFSPPFRTAIGTELSMIIKHIFSYFVDRSKPGSSATDSVLVQTHDLTSQALEFERSDAARRLKLVIAELVAIVAQVIFAYLFAAMICFRYIKLQNGVNIVSEHAYYLFNSGSKYPERRGHVRQFSI